MNLFFSMLPSYPRGLLDLSGITVSLLSLNQIGLNDELTLQGDGCTALVMATMLNKTPVVKVLVAAHVKRGIGVDHRTVRGMLLLFLLLGGDIHDRLFKCLKNQQLAA